MNGLLNLVIGAAASWFLLKEGKVEVKVLPGEPLYQPENVPDGEKKRRRRRKKK